MMGIDRLGALRRLVFQEEVNDLMTARLESC